jgi:hypothetical protein
MRSVIALEGVPGSGKTSCFSLLLGQFSSRSVFLSEMNPEPDASWVQANPVVQGDYFDKYWVERADLIKNSHHSFFLDRSYLSNLAYWYATDGLLGTMHYKKRKEFALAYFGHTLFDAVVVLSCPPATSIQRRLQANIPTNPPWDDPIFLKYFAGFYRTEVPELVSAKILFLDTHQLKVSEVVRNVQAELVMGWLPSAPEKISQDTQKALELFATKQHLGSALAKVCTILGLPTMYFRQHSLQCDGGNIVYFNNQQLRRRLYATI